MADMATAAATAGMGGFSELSGSGLIQNVKKFFALQRINLSFALFWP